MRSEVRIAYGLGITGLDAVHALPPAGARRPPWVVAVSQTTRPAPPTVPPDDGVLRTLPDGRAVVMHRAARTARFHGPTLSADVLAHPYLTLVGIRFNRWLGRECFHAGVFAAGGKAWLLFGPRTAGKSSLLAALAAAGWGVAADDLAVTDGQVVFRGPRTIDLREPLPGRALPTEAARGGSRMRVALGPIADRLPMGGTIFLHWSTGSGASGSRPHLRPVESAPLLSRLARCRILPELPTDPLTPLALAGFPAFDLHRPRRWSALPDTIAAIADVTGSGSGADARSQVPAGSRP